LNWSADRSAILISTELRFRSCLCEEIPRIERFIPKELEGAAVELIASGFAQHHDGSPIRPPIFGGIRIDVELELGDAIDDRVVNDLPWLRLQDTDAVIEIFIRPRPAAVDARQCRSTAGQRHAGRECDERNEAASIERK